MGLALEIPKAQALSHPNLGSSACGALADDPVGLLRGAQAIDWRDSLRRSHLLGRKPRTHSEGVRSMEKR